jgi:hypothetical protein
MNGFPGRDWSNSLGTSGVVRCSALITNAVGRAGISSRYTSPTDKRRKSQGTDGKPDLHAISPRAE